MADLDAPHRSALLIIDLQRGFFESDDMAAQEDRIVAATNELMRQAAARDLPIFHVVTEHARDKTTWTLSMLSDDQGFNFTGTQQAEPLPDLDRVPGIHLIKKIRDSGFHATDLAQRLRLARVTRLVIAGVESENCVALTAREAFAYDFEAAIALDAVGSRKPERGRQALEDNRDEVRQPLLRLAEVADWW